MILDGFKCDIRIYCSSYDNIEQVGFVGDLYLQELQDRLDGIEIMFFLYLFLLLDYSSWINFNSFFLFFMFVW